MADSASPQPIPQPTGYREKWRAAWRYWVSDTAQGLLNIGIHSALRLLPTGLCSDFGACAGKLSPYRYRESDARARRLWAALHPDKSDPATLDRVMRTLWDSVGRTMAEYAVLDRLWGEGRITFQ